MKKKNRIEDTLDFGIRSASVQGILSSCCLGLEVILFLTGIYISYLQNGNAGSWLGLIGFGTFALSVAGLVFSVIGLMKGHTHHGPDWLGLIGNTIVLSAVCTLFVIGTSL